MLFNPTRYEIMLYKYKRGILWLTDNQVTFATNQKFSSCSIYVKF